MKRLLRWTFNGAAALSAVLLLVTGVLWVMSYQFKTLVCGESGGISYGISTRDGQVFVFKGVIYDPQGRLLAQPTRWSATGDDLKSVEFTPLILLKPTPTATSRFWPAAKDANRFDFDSNGNIYLNWVAAAPLWSIAIAFLVLPALVALRQLYSPKRTRRGCCRTCGYDLRATPNRCPECGSVSVL